MKRISAYILIIMLITLSIFGTGCLLVDGEKEPININLVINADSYENAYFRSAVSRFEEDFIEKEYGEIYKGVRASVMLCEERDYSLKNQSFSPYDIYVTDERFGSNVRGWASEGNILPIEEVFKTKFDLVDGVKYGLDDKLSSSSLPALMSDYQEYFAVPNASEIVGLTYDVNSFDKNGYYFANDKSNSVEFYSDITARNYYFVKPTYDENVVADNKSLGMDGIIGTADDGLPTTINEFVALCELIKSQDKYPFVASGKDVYKCDYLVQALTYALMGEEEASACMNLEGEVEVVVGYTDQPLFEGFDEVYGQIYKPKTEKVTLSENCGYYASWSVAKYYAEAFMELSVKMDWWADASFNSNVINDKLYFDFVLSGYDSGRQEALMLCDSSTWYKEMESLGHLKYFNDVYNYNNNSERRLQWMPIPTLFNGEEDYAEQRKTQTYQQVSPTFMVIADQVKSSALKYEACMDLLMYLCTEAECKYYTASTGFRKDFDYELDIIDLYKISDYYGSLEEITFNANVISYASDKLTFKKSPQFFEGGKKDSRYFYYKQLISYDELTEEVEYREYKTAFEYFTFFSKPTSKYCFLNGLVDKKDWEELYGGYEEITYYVDKNGKAVTFNG